MKGHRQKIVSLFNPPIYTSTGVHRIEDLDRLGIWNVLDGFSEEKADSVIDRFKSVVSICPELAICFLTKFRERRDLLNNGFPDGWVKTILDIYDQKGLHPACKAVLHPEESSPVNGMSDQGVQLKNILRLLQIYVAGLGGGDLKLAEGEVHYTDTLVIYLPPAVTIFPDQSSNFLLYKLMTTHKLGQIQLGTFKRHRTIAYPEGQPQKALRLSVILECFPDPSLARDLFQLLDTVRVEAWISEVLPGLYRDLKNVKDGLAQRLSWVPNGYPKSALIVSLIRMMLGQDRGHYGGDPWTGEADKIWDLFGLARRPDAKLSLLEKILAQAYQIASGIPGSYQPVRPGFYVGELRLQEVERVFMAKNNAKPEGVGKAVNRTKKTVVDPENPGDQEFVMECEGNVLPFDEDTKIKPEENENAEDETRPFNPGLTWEIPDPIGSRSAVNEGEVFYFDEWDFRRQGYRKNWVQLREFEVPEADLRFAKTVLTDYKWTIKNIRDQFERIRMHYLLRRRQKEGDDIDLDAVVESLCQLKAGISPSENLYTRLNRDERDICTVFLIDLSRSTAGFINLMERSALLILAKTLETLNDQYAIFGFSGQTRKYCELFRIKSFHESFSEKVMGKIAGLTPSHCTRMGPPVRRLTDILHAMEAKSKLLVTLTDGRPYDYDGYHGEYALADTRQAILEARRKGIVPFCLTIDKTEHAYLPRLYGAGHYVFIDDISQIPRMMPRIYINLTNG